MAGTRKSSRHCSPVCKPSLPHAPEGVHGPVRELDGVYGHFFAIAHLNLAHFGAVHPKKINALLTHEK